MRIRPFAFCALALLTAPSPAPAAESFLVAAHRGGRGLAPENTLGAFRLAHQTWGAQGIWLEMDVHLTFDGIPVIIHDADLSRTTNCTGFVHEKYYTELAECDASESFPGWGSFEPIPSLRQVLDEGCEAGWRLMIEIKDIPTEPDFDATGNDKVHGIFGVLLARQDCRENVWSKRIMFQSFWPPTLDHLELEEAEYATILLTTSNLVNGIGFPASSNIAFARARRYEVSAPNHDSPDLDAATIALAHALDRRVIPWTVNNRTRIDELRAAGADGVITDHPALAY
jgi:glycerophosphoryl diester phosphodiesterase